MRFTWDPHKSERNLVERGFDFEFATLIFDGPTVERTDSRRNYGEHRVIALGIAQGLSLTVVFTDRAGIGARSSDASSQPARVTAVSEPRTRRPSSHSRVVRGQAKLSKLRRTTDREIRATSPAELADLPEDFWASATVVTPTVKQPISLRVDADVLDWFKTQGPRYQSRINAVLRSYMTQRRQSARRAG